MTDMSHHTVHFYNLHQHLPSHHSPSVLVITSPLRRLNSLISDLVPAVLCAIFGLNRGYGRLSRCTGIARRLRRPPGSRSADTLLPACHSFVAVITFTDRWFLSTMPLPDGACSAMYRTRVHHSLAKAKNARLWNAVALSASSSDGGPLLENSSAITFPALSYRNCRQIANLDGPQSTTVG